MFVFYLTILSACCSQVMSNSLNDSSQLNQTNVTLNVSDMSEEEKSYVFKQARTEIKQENYSEALKKFNSLLQSKPTNRILNANVALCYYKLKHYEQAVYHADKALNKNGMYSLAKKVKANSMFKMAKIAFAGKNFTQSENLYLKALLLRPNDKFILANFACLLYSREKYEDAANYAQLALNIDSKFTFSKVFLSKSLLKLGQIELYTKGNVERALKFFIKSAEFKPTLELLTDLAFAYLSLKEYDKAIKYADIVISRRPNDSLAKEIKATCLLNKAEISRESRKYPEFISYLEKSFELVPGDSFYVYSRYASLCFNLKYYENALRYATLALEFDKESKQDQEIRNESTKCLNNWNYFLIHC